MKAERKRREAILRAEGEKNPQSYVAEGKRICHPLMQRQRNRQLSSVQRLTKRLPSARQKVRQKQSLKIQQANADGLRI